MQSGLLPNVLPWRRCTHANLGTCKGNGLPACMSVGQLHCASCAADICSAPVCSVTANLFAMQHNPWPVCLVPKLPIGLLQLAAPSVAPALVNCFPSVFATVPALHSA